MTGKHVDGSREVRATPCAALSVGKNLRVYSGYVPTLGLRVLPRCAACGDKHPLAYQPPLPPEWCPTCGSRASAPDAEIEVPAVLTDRRPATLMARACLAIGAALRRFAERFEG